MRSGWLVPILVLLSAPCFGQTLAWDHDGVNVASFTVQIDSAPRVSVDASVRSYGLAGVAPGAHVFTVAACNVVLTCTASLPFTATLGSPAPVPDPTPIPVPDPVPTPVPTPTPVPVPVPVTCLDGSASFPQGFVMWVYTKVSGSFTANSDYKRLLAAGWTYVPGSAYRQRANYYNLQFRCGA